MRATINYGIDLGTTNSAIACQIGMETKVLTGDDGLLVPSVVHISAAGEFQAGSAAVAFRATDSANVASEFKRLMGTAENIHFPAAGRSFTPAELSAKVLQHLIHRAERHAGSGPPIQAAVITIPAMFQLPQCEATKEAAGMAGLLHAPLLQEPIAAAIASAGEAELREGYWLIYDFGGGTFDVSLVRSRSGRLQVLDHDGDNHLGGKDFDRLLARRAADTVRAQCALGDFRRSDPAMADAFESIRVEAERVRVALSTADSAEFHADLRRDGAVVASVRFEVTRADLESLIRPVISRTVAVCAQILERNGVTAAELKRLVLVGGPTLTPCLPAIIQAELGVEARHYVDPSKAVAIGAAIYASTQRIPANLRPAPTASVSLDLSYEPMTNDLRPLVAGQLKGDIAPGLWEVRITSGTSEFDTGRLALRAGSFATRVELRSNALNAFEIIVLRDGVRVDEAGGSFSIIQGTTIARPVLSQSVAVVLADNTVRWYLRKGVNLPARQRISHTTTIGLRRGQSGDAVNVPLIQGENEYGDRNTLIGVIQIQPQNISRDLPAGSEVVVTLSVDEHSTTHAEAYVPLLDTTFSQIVKFGLKTQTAEAINDGVKSQRDRLSELQKMADDLGEDGGEIDGRVRLIEELLEEGGADERNQAGQLLQKVTGLIDSMEVRDKETALKEQFTNSSERAVSLLDKDDSKRNREHAALSHEFHAAIARADFHLAEARSKAMRDLEYSLLREQPGYWKALFDWLCAELLKGPRAAEARIPIDDGKAAINRGDVPGLIQACYALIRLLPEQQQKAIPESVLSTVT